MQKNGRYQKSRRGKRSTTQGELGVLGDELRSISDERSLIVDPNAGLGRGYLIPKAFQAQQTCSQKVRFIIGAAGVSSYTFLALDLIKMLCFSTALNTLYPLAKAVKLKYIEMWEAFDGSTLSNNTIGFIYYGVAGTNTGTNRAYFDTSASTSRPAHVYAPAPKDTVLSFWQNSATGLTFGDFRGLNPGTTVDICFDWISNGDFASAATVSFAGTAASAGLVGIHPMTSAFAAVGWNNM